MKFSLFAASACLLSAVQAATVEFKIVAPGAKSVQVNVNGQATALNAPYPNVPFYNGTVEVGASNSYNYIVDGKQEGFARSLPANILATNNDFYNRPITIASVPALPRPLDNGKQWTKADKNPDLFDTNFIPTVFVNGDESQINNLVETVPKDKVTVELTFIGRDYVQQFRNVSLGISGAGKKHNPAKQSWRWYLSEGDFINNRNIFKIRHMEEDPTQMREKLYADVLRAMGTYANQANMVRFYMNGEGYGTFNMLEDVDRYSYIRATFYGGNPPAQMGPVYDGGSGASFKYSEDTDGYSSFEPTKGSPEGYEAIAPLAEAFSKLNLQDNNAIQEFEKMFDVDQFLRFMVMEYLTGSWDAYWMMQTNDGAYKDYADNNKWYYLGQDYDATFGVNLAEDVMNLSYKDYIEKNPEAVLINGFLQNNDLRSRFESYLVDTVKTLFNNNTLGNHIMTYREFIAPDLEWDRSIKQRSPGMVFNWSYEQTYENLFHGVDSPTDGIGGAAYGLTEWIAKKAAVVAKEFNFTL
ncbi:Inner spore coat protein H [Choanephora cucurbitarum]|uniref:Inner spore coat protein H n=1 Tax=Choanephora cucurbitarum TaxID=101091 RepID=A0A1C7NNR3_9FUNG|nr:Inner spore coat protein H [Choanephora cucurbitarum]